jgi:hypothetical protein
MVDVGDDREVADVGGGRCHATFEYGDGYARVYPSAADAMAAFEGRGA